MSETNMTPAPDQPSYLKSKIWLPILITSLVLNGLVAGLLIAGATHHSRRGAPPPYHTAAQSGPFYMRQVLRFLPNERRHEVLKQANEALGYGGRDEMRQKFGHLETARGDVIAALSTDPTDMDGLTKALNDMRTTNAEISIQGDALVIEILSLLTPDEQTAMREQIKMRGFNRKPDHRRKRRGRQRQKP